MDKEFKFEGSVPQYYDKLFGEQLFEPYAKDLVSRISNISSELSHVLELGCGTGRCTRQVMTQINGLKEFIVTDVSEEMLKFAKDAIEFPQHSLNPLVSWQVVDECDLPYKDNYFDLIICQFGFMFSSDKATAMAESMRVLRPGGLLLFNVWDDIENNPLCYIADNVIKTSHPQDHDDFFSLPYSMHDREAVIRMLSETGFTSVTAMDETIKCSWQTAHEAAAAIVDGSPIALILKERGENVNITVEALTRAYNEYKISSIGTEIENEGISFTMSAVIFKCYKPLRPLPIEI